MGLKRLQATMFKGGLQRDVAPTVENQIEMNWKLLVRASVNHRCPGCFMMALPRDSLSRLKGGEGTIITGR